jgi:hypothetical protein
VSILLDAGKGPDAFGAFFVDPEAMDGAFMSQQREATWDDENESTSRIC